MATTINLLDSISEIQPFDYDINSNEKLEDLNEKMDDLCEQITEDFKKFKYKLENVDNFLEKIFKNKNINENFECQELIEEQIDSLFYDYTKIKPLLSKGREIRCFIEAKEKEKEREMMYIRNELAQYGIKSNNQ